MARPRKTSKTLRSLSDCNDAMCALKIAALQCEHLKAARDKAIAAITDKYEPDITDLVNMQKDLELQLQNYYMAHLTELEKDEQKSVKLAHGVMGRRKDPVSLVLLNKAWTWASAQVAVLAKLGKTYMRYADPEIDKDAIKSALKNGDLKVEDVEACGLKQKQDEKFYAEPTRTETTGA